MPARLECFEIKGLFGQFDHRIPLRLEDRITAILAPNGLGKTVCLKLIHAILTRKHSLLRTTYFDDIILSFSSRERIEIARRAMGPNEASKEPEANPSIEFAYVAPDGKRTRWQLGRSTLGPSNFDFVSHFVPQVTRRGLEVWTDDETGEQLSLDEIVEQYGDQIPDTYLQRKEAPEPPEARVLLSSIDCRLIETQRLLSTPVLVSPERERHARVVGHVRKSQSQLAVTQKAQRLAQILQSALTDYANRSQKLDRSFPRTNS